MSNYEDLGILTIDGGDVVPKLDYAIQQAIKNCIDPDTEASAKRRVTLTITMKPSEDRGSAALEYKIDSKLPGDAPGGDHVLISCADEKGYVPKRQLGFDELGMTEEVNEVTGEVTPVQNNVRENMENDYR